MGVEIAVKGNDGTEFLALLALETFEDSGLAVCNQFLHLIIGKIFSRFLSEDGQAALLVVATHDLMEELHLSRSTFRAGAFRLFVSENLLARKQFGGNQTGVFLDTSAEIPVVHLSTLDFGKRLFPFTRHGDICNLHLLDDIVECQSLFGRYKGFVGTHHIAACKQRSNRQAAAHLSCPHRRYIASPPS